MHLQGKEKAGAYHEIEQTVYRDANLPELGLLTIKQLNQYDYSSVKFSCGYNVDMFISFSLLHSTASNTAYQRCLKGTEMQSDGLTPTIRLCHTQEHPIFHSNTKKCHFLNMPAFLAYMFLGSILLNSV